MPRSGSEVNTICKTFANSRATAVVSSTDPPSTTKTWLGGSPNTARERSVFRRPSALLSVTVTTLTVLISHVRGRRHWARQEGDQRKPQMRHCSQMSHLPKDISSCQADSSTVTLLKVRLHLATHQSVELLK
jgi:hypothetical protein